MKICYCIRQTQGGYKRGELSAKSMRQILHKLSKAILNELNNSLPTLGYLGSKVLYFIPEPRNFAEVARLPADVKKAWLKNNLKEIKHIINN